MEILNREKLKESESFVLTLQKDKISGETTKKRINVRKIKSLFQNTAAKIKNTQRHSSSNTGTGGGWSVVHFRSRDKEFQRALQL